LQGRCGYEITVVVALEEFMPVFYLAGVNAVLVQHVVDEFAAPGGLGTEQNAFEGRFFDKFSQRPVGLLGCRLQR
jgi:hypothetical protein